MKRNELMALIATTILMFAYVCQHRLKERET